ncbi:MAG TPA: DUF2292 domain-containing protein [Dongiaceae bacterium]|nr:DUF2292 domain-containing protein [Dongiaceae bacterium]
MAELNRSPDDPQEPDVLSAPEALLREIARAVRGLRYGSVEITVHDGAVVQIERKEKIRVGRDQTRSKG